MLATKDNCDDVRKYYQSTWIKFQEEGDVLFYVESANPYSIDVVSVSGEKCQIDLSLNNGAGYMITYLLPRKTTFQYQNTAVMLSRIPARMWKKGVCSQNTSFRMLKVSGWQTIDFSRHMLEGFVNKPCYATVENLINDAGMQSVALSPRISMTKNGHVYIDDIMVGKYNFEKKVLTTRAIYESNLKPFFQTSTIKVLA